MIVNPAYMYMSKKKAAPRTLWENGTLNYQYSIESGRVTFNSAGNFLELTALGAALFQNIPVNAGDTVTAVFRRPYNSDYSQGTIEFVNAAGVALFSQLIEVLSATKTVSFSVPQGTTGIRLKGPNLTVLVNSVSW